MGSPKVGHNRATRRQQRTAAQETVSHAALRGCSTGVVGKGHCICDFGEGAVPVIKDIFLQRFSTSPMKPLLVTRKSPHHEGF